MILPVLVAIIFPLAAGIQIVRTAWHPRAGVFSRLLQFTIASALGLGISSCTFFLWLALPEARSLPLAVAEPAFFACAAVAFFLLEKRGSFLLSNTAPGPSSGAPARAAGFDRLTMGLVIGFCLVLACAAVSMILVLINRPLGLGDAYAIWNVKARFLFRDQGQWMKAFSPLMFATHPDYPLLMPAGIARLWTYLGSETRIVPQVIAVFFTLATVSLLAASLSILRSVKQGLLAAVFLLAAPLFVRLGSWQYADVPLGFFMLAALVLLTLKNVIGGNGYGLTFLAGMMAGFAAWTKNEGNLFVLAVFIALSAVILAKRDYRLWVRESSVFLAGCLPVIAVLIYFKLRCAPPNYLFRSLDSGSVAAGLLNLQRFLLITKAFVREFFHWGDGLTAVFLGYAILAGLSGAWRKSVGAPAGFIVLFLMLAGYCATYMVTPLDLGWHLATSLDRLLAQLWPTFLFTAFLVISPVGRKDSE